MKVVKDIIFMGIKNKEKYSKNFYKNIINNFDIRVKKDRIKKLKNKGVISECNYLDIYNP
jgi:hypothetical protein